MRSSHGCSGRSIYDLSCKLIDAIWARIRLLEVEEFFKFAQLSLKAHVWEYDWPAFASELESLLEEHVLFLHQVSNDYTSAPRDSRITMYQHAALGHALLNEWDSSREVSNQTRLTCVRHRYHFVLKVLWKEGFNAGRHLKDVCYASRLQSVHIRCSLEIAKIQTVDYSIHFYLPSLPDSDFYLLNNIVILENI